MQESLRENDRRKPLLSWACWCGTRIGRKDKSILTRSQSESRPVSAPSIEYLQQPPAAQFHHSKGKRIMKASQPRLFWPSHPYFISFSSFLVKSSQLLFLPLKASTQPFPFFSPLPTLFSAAKLVDVADEPFSGFFPSPSTPYLASYCTWNFSRLPRASAVMQRVCKCKKIRRLRRAPSQIAEALGPLMDDLTSGDSESVERDGEIRASVRKWSERDV